MNDSMVFYRSFLEGVRCLPRDKQLDALDAIFDYGFYGAEPEITGTAAVPYIMAKPQIDANTKRKNAGTSGGRPKTNGYENEKPMVSKSKTNGYENEKPMVSKSKTNGYENENHRLENEKPNVNVNVNDNVNVNENVKENENVNESENAPTPPKRYGLYNNVLLTDDEVQSLTIEFPERYQEMIENLSTYMHTHGKRYNDHFAILCKWEREDQKNKKGATQQTPPKRGSAEELDAFYKMAANWAAEGESDD